MMPIIKQQAYLVEKKIFVLSFYLFVSVVLSFGVNYTTHAAEGQVEYFLRQAADCSSGGYYPTQNTLVCPATSYSSCSYNKWCFDYKMTGVTRTCVIKNKTNSSTLTLDSTKNTIELTTIPSTQTNYTLECISSSNPNDKKTMDIILPNVGKGQPVITGVTNLSTSSAEISWLPTDGASQYNLRYKVTGSPTWTTISNISTTNRLVNELQQNTTYDVQVSSICEGTESSFSNSQVTQFTTKPIAVNDCDAANPPTLPVEVPGGIFVDNISKSRATVHWNAVKGAKGYIVRLGPLSRPQSVWAHFTVCDPNTSVSVNNISSDSSFGAIVRTNCSNCETAFGNTDKRSSFSSVFNFSTLKQ